MPNALPIVKEPHPVLRVKARDIPITDIRSKKVQDLVAAMKVTLKGTPDGVGLAASQVGEDLRLFIISDEAEEIDRMQAKRDRSEEGKPLAGAKPYPIRDWHYYVFINPQVTGKSRKKIDGHEGCLSVPNVFGNIKRQEKITVEAFDEHGKKFTRGASRFFARVIQHELDHLEGALFIDHATHLVKTE